MPVVIEHNTTKTEGVPPLSLSSSQGQSATPTIELSLPLSKKNNYLAKHITIHTSNGIIVVRTKL